LMPAVCLMQRRPDEHVTRSSSTPSRISPSSIF
jgi:hypothetical protein